MYQSRLVGYPSNMELEGKDGIFMKIARREVPAHIIYEDEKTLAFLSAGPVTPGHTLVIPKVPVRNVFDADQETFAAVMETVRRISPAVRDAVGAKGVHINSNHEPEAGQAVFHLHIHIVPRHTRNEFEFWPETAYGEGEAEQVSKTIKERIA